ncbi:MAG: LUD domain-containing protein [Planctomycetaceae bacterium]|jgi:L-lactate dehydrogenase complex protein LldG|nr:LUD domain-containing protein [Planctomycetaceae bacterium]
MTTKAEFLKTVKQSLADLNTSTKPELPPVPEVWAVNDVPTEQLRQTFAESLTSVAGRCVFVDKPDETAVQVANLLRENGVKRVGVLGTEAAKSVAERVTEHYSTELFFSSTDEADASGMSKLDAGILTPEYLLADTGSCVISAPTSNDRRLIYMPPLCVIVAKATSLREHLPQAWQEFLPRWKTATAGEFVIVTGPSRTADIEKILVLGVHGPKQVVVFVETFS